MSVVPLLVSMWSGCSLFSGGEPEGGVQAPDEGGEETEPRRKKNRNKRGSGGDVDPTKVQGRFKPTPNPCSGPDTPGLFELNTDFGGESVKSLVFVPPGPGPHDLVVILHGGTSTPEKILKQTRFTEQALEDGFAVLAPTSGEIDDHGKHWNTGKFEGIAKRTRDDVAFLDQLARRARQELCVGRVLAAGFSSGGQMAHRWGCQGREADAVLSAAGELLVPTSGCKPKPALGYVGTLDKVFDEAPLEGSDQLTAVQTMEAWAKINGCDIGKPPSERTMGDATCKAWRGCSQPTELCVVEGFPHGWPAPWHNKKSTQCNATADGMAWFKGTAPKN